MKNVFRSSLWLALLITCMVSVAGLAQDSLSNQQSTEVGSKTLDQSGSEIPENPFDPTIDTEESKRRALAWFDFLKVALTLAAGWLLKLITKKIPNFKFGKFLPLGIFAVAFIGFGIGYGWDLPMLAKNTISIITALAFHAVVLNPVESLVQGKPIVKKE
jgi:hypothetical protein